MTLRIVSTSKRLGAPQLSHPKNTLMRTQDISLAVKLSLASKVNVVKKPGYGPI